MLQQDLVICKSHPDGTGFGGMRGHEEQLMLSSVRGHGRPLVQVSASVAIDGPGLEGVMHRSRGLLP